MRIAIVTSPFCALPPDAIGAVEQRWFNIATVFSKTGNGVQIIGKKDKTVLPSTKWMVRTYVKGYCRTASVYLDILLDFFYSIRALRRLNPCDVLVANTFWVPILAPLFFRRRYGKLVYNVARFPKRHLRLYRRVDLFACTSQAVKMALLGILPSRMKDWVVVVNNPIDTSVFYYDGVTAGKKKSLIGYHGRINREKGLDILATAVAMCAKDFPDVRLALIGSWDVGCGGSGEAYRRELDRLSGNRIDWLGPIANRKELAAKLRLCEIYCYPSVAEKGETFGVSPLEAMGLGLPVIVSSLACFRDFVDHGRTGIVFDHRADNASRVLVEKLYQLLSDTSLRDRIGHDSAMSAKRFSNANIAREYLENFRRIIEQTS